MSFKERILKQKQSFTVLEEAKLTPEQIKLIHDLAKKDNLKIGYTQNSHLGDNAAFMPKKEYEKALKELKDPAFLEKIFKDTKLANSIKRQRQTFAKSLKQAETQNVGGSIDDGIIILGKGKVFANKPEIIGHELGHAVNHRENRWLAPLRHGAITLTGGIASSLLARSGHPGLAALTAGAAFAPTLYDEGKASIHGYKNLKELGKKPRITPLALGFSTYALGATLPMLIGAMRSSTGSDDINIPPELMSEESRQNLKEALGETVYKNVYGQDPFAHALTQVK